MTRRLLPLLLCTLFALNVRASTEIEPKVLGPTAGNVSDVASAYVGGKYLTVWRQLFMPSVGIWGAFTGADGIPLGPAFQVLGSNNALDLRLYADGDSFLLVWNDSNKTEWMCHVDNSGRATTPKEIYPDWGFRPDAFVDHRLVTVDRTINNRGATIFDDDGGTVRSGFAPAEFWQGQTAFAGNGSFFLGEAEPDLTLSRYSLDGDLLQTFTFEKDNCATANSPCSGIADLEELGSGTILVLLWGSQGLTTMTVAADGTQSAKTVIPTSFPQLSDASLQRTGSQIWAVVAGSQQSEGPYDVDAYAVDGSGIPTGSSVTLLRNVGPYGISVIAEGPDSLLAAALAVNPSQVETALLRDQSAGDQQIVSITPSIQQNTQVASNGNSYLAAWSDADGVGFNETHWAVLDATGQRRSPVFADGGDMFQHSLVSNGLDYLMLINGGGPILARRIAADGTLLGDTVLPGPNADYLYNGIAVVPTTAGYLVVWSSGDVVSSEVVTPSGTVSTPQELFRIQGVPEGRAASYYNPALASNGGEVLLVITRIEGTIVYFPGDPSDATAELDAFRLRSDGSLVTPDPLQLLSSGAGYSPTFAASNGQEFLVASGGERFEITPAGVAKTYQTGTLTTPTDLIWDGQNYVVARDGDAFEHVARDGSTLDTQFRHGVEGLDLAADSSGHLLLVGSESSVAGPLRAYSYTPSDFLSFTKRRRAALP